MIEFLVSAVAGAAVLLGFFGGRNMLRKSGATRAVSRLHATAPRGLHESESHRGERRSLLEPLVTRFSGTKGGGRFFSYVAENHPSTSASDALALALCGIIGGGLAGWLLLGAGPLVILAAAIGPLVVDRILLQLGGRRTAKLEAQLPEAFALQASALRAGHSTTRSLRLLAEELKAPLNEEMARTVKELDVGHPLETALSSLVTRTGSRDLQLWVTAMLVHRQTGGNLSAILDSLARRIRERAQMRGEVRALTAQARMSGLVVALAPLGFFLLLSATSRDQMQVLYSTPAGLVVLATGLAMQLAGFLWIRKILAVRD